MKPFVLILSFLFSIVLAQTEVTRKSDNIVGSTIHVQSEILGEEVELQVFLPDGYADSENEFPTVYILDGQRYFLHGVSLQKSFTDFKQAPEFIVVGISRNPANRNRNYSVNSANYLKFIKEEVIPFVDSGYRTSEERLLFGWAFGGGFVIESMVNEPDLFDAYIAASPFPLKPKVSKVDSLLKANTDFNKLLFFTSGTNEGSVKEGTHELNKLLSKNTAVYANWTFAELGGEEHRSTPFTTLYRGIRKQFAVYPELQFSNLDEFVQAGGLPFVYEYYNKRAEKYGFPAELSDWTMFSITRNAMRANNLKYFEKLVSEFRPTGYIKRLRVSRACSIAEFYLEYKQPAKARGLFLEIAEENPNSARALNGIGNSYKAEKNEQMANQYFKKAEEASKSN